MATHSSCHFFTIGTPSINVEKPQKRYLSPCRKGAELNRPISYQHHVPCILSHEMRRVHYRNYLPIRMGSISTHASEVKFPTQPHKLEQMTVETINFLSGFLPFILSTNAYIEVHLSVRNTRCWSKR